MNIHELIAERDGLAAAVDRMRTDFPRRQFSAHIAEIRDLNKMIDHATNTVDTECEVVETRIEKKEDELIGAFKQSIVNARTR